MDQGQKIEVEVLLLLVLDLPEVVVRFLPVVLVLWSSNSLPVEVLKPSAE